MLFYTQTLTDVLAERFTDMDEVRDIANHGCAMGVSGFIYYHETTKFFHDYEDDIEDVCYDTLGDDFMSIVAKNTTSVQGMSSRYDTGHGMACHRDILSVGS